METNISNMANENAYLKKRGTNKISYTKVVKNCKHYILYNRETLILLNLHQGTVMVDTISSLTCSVCTAVSLLSVVSLFSKGSLLSSFLAASPAFTVSCY